jgi:hypothetical protein
MTLQDSLDIAQLVEMEHPLGAASQFAGGLRATQEQHADNSDFATGKVEDLLAVMLKFRYASVSAHGTGETVIFQAVKSLTNFDFIKGSYGFAIVLLIAGVDQCVERERVVLRGGDFFFDERAEDAGLSGRELHGHGAIVTDSRGHAGDDCR